MTAIRNALSKVFQLEKGEGLTFGLLSFALFLSIGGYYVIGRTVSRSLFLSNLPPELISVRYIAVTVGIVLVSMVYTRYSTRFRRDYLIVGTTAVMATGVLLFRILLATPLGDSLLILGGLFVFLEIAATLTIIQFWTFAADLLNSREAKRMYSPIASMGSLGGILAGAVVSVAAVSLGAANLLLVLLAAQIGYALCIWFLGRGHPEDVELSSTTSRPQERQASSVMDGFREIRAIPLLFSIAAIIVVTTMVSNIIEYQFDLTLQSNFLGNEAGMTAFLGSYYFWAGVIGFAFQLFVAGRLLGRFGITLGLLVLPLSFAFGSTLILATGAGLWAVTTARLSDTVFRYNLNDTALSLLDLPLDRDTRARAKGVINGILKPLAIGTVGLLFLVVGNLRGISPLPWSFLVLALIVVWLILIRRGRHQYKEALATSILRRRFDPALEAINISDETTKEILLDALRQSDEAQVLQALSLVKEAPQIDWSSALVPLLDHPATAVRIEALDRMAQPLYAPHVERIQQLFTDPEGDVRAAAITTVCAIREADAISDISPCLEDDNPVVRAAAVTGIIRYGGLNGILQGALALKGMLDHADPAMRRAGADTLGLLEIKTFFQPLLLLLEDENVEVQTHALHAAGKLGHPDLLPAVIGLLGPPATRTAATQALLAFGPDSYTVFGQFLADTAVDIQVRRQIPIVLGRIAAEPSVYILLQHLDEPDNHTRARIYKALVRLQARGVPIPVAEDVLISRLQEELRLAYDMAVTRLDLEQYLEGTLLADALKSQQGFSLDRVFFLLGLHYPSISMAEIQFSVVAADTRRRANATELLDTTLDRPIKHLLLPLLEGPEDRLLHVATTEMGLERYSPEERTSQLVASGDNWIIALTLYTLSHTKWPHLGDLIADYLQCEDGLLRETSIAAAYRYFPESEYLDILRAQSANTSFPSVSSYARRCLMESENLLQQGAKIMPLSTVERVLFLRSVDLFRDVASEDLVLIAQVCQETFFAAGERFIRQGEIGECLYILVDGTAAIDMDGVGKVDWLGPEEVVGEMAILSRSPRSANCRAESDMTALRIDFEDFWDLLAEKPGLALGVIRVLSARLHDQYEHVSAA